MAQRPRGRAAHDGGRADQGQPLSCTYPLTRGFVARAVRRSAADAITLPIPSTIPDVVDPEDVRPLSSAWPRRSVRHQLIGHFGTYGDHMARELDAIVPAIAERASAREVRVHRRSQYRVSRAPVDRTSTMLHGRAWASGRLSRVPTSRPRFEPAICWCSRIPTALRPAAPR